MNREEVIQLAREAGLALVYTESDEDGWRELERFAALVAAAEREACAAICDRLERRYGEGPEVEHWAQGFKKGATICQNRIRARGEK